MYKAITTKYLGPTDRRGSRIKAYDSDGNQVTIGRCDDLNIDDNHQKAAEALCAKMGWTGRLAGGGIKDGYVFVFVDQK